MNPSLLETDRGSDKSLEFNSVHSLPFPHANVECNISIYREGLDHAMVKVQKIECVPLSQQTVDNDREEFSHIIWDVADPDVQLLVDNSPPTSDRAQLSGLLDRVASFYLRILDQEIPHDHSARTTPPYNGLFQLASRIGSQYSRGERAFWKQEWEQDTPQSLAVLRDPYASSVDMKILTELGKNLFAIVKGNESAMDLIRRSNLVDWCTTGLEVATFTTYLAKTVKQVVHRYPHMHILELGTEIGTVTKSILQEIGQKCASYTITASSSAPLPLAESWLKQYKDKTIFKPLDHSKDLRDQGFAEGSYDLVVAFSPLRVPCHLEKLLQNSRRLLKPGGRLVVVELLPSSNPFFGLVFGAFGNRWPTVEMEGNPSLAITPAEWDCLLQRTRFSGIDTSTTRVDGMAPFSVFVSQAVDDKIAFLRDPLSLEFPSHSHESAPDALIQDLIILGGNPVESTQLVDELSPVLEPYCGTIRTLYSFVDILGVDLMPNTVVLCVADLAQPVFKRLSDETWAAMKKITLYAGTLAWVTQGRLSINPFANIILGLVRGAARDNPAFHYLLLDYGHPRHINHHDIAEHLLRFQAGLQWWNQGDVHLTVETEILIDGAGRLLIPRLMLNEEMNNRYNSSGREVRSLVRLRDHNIRLSRNDSEWNIELEPLPHTIHDESIQLQVTHSLLSPVRVAEFGCMFVALGRHDASGDT